MKTQIYSTPCLDLLMRCCLWKFAFIWTFRRGLTMFGGSLKFGETDLWCFIDEPAIFDLCPYISALDYPHVSYENSWLYTPFTLISFLVWIFAPFTSSFCHSHVILRIVCNLTVCINNFVLCTLTFVFWTLTFVTSFDLWTLTLVPSFGLWTLTCPWTLYRSTSQECK